VVCQRFPRLFGRRPKWFHHRDWRAIGRLRSAGETFVAVPAQGCVEGWDRSGVGDFELLILPADTNAKLFYVVRDRQPWFLIELQSHCERASPPSSRTSRADECGSCFQGVRGLSYHAADCFKSDSPPVVVSGKSFLSHSGDFLGSKAIAKWTIGTRARGAWEIFQIRSASSS